MVVEIEGVQKIIRRIRAEKSCIEDLIENGLLMNIELCMPVVLDMKDDCERLVSLVLAETGHWQPGIFSASLHIANHEQAIREEDIDEIAQIPVLYQVLAEYCVAEDDFTAALAKFLNAAEILCSNISEYVIHTELPV